MNNQDWHARWIWCSGDERPKNFYLYVRKSFLVSGDIKRASIRLTADSRYQLFVNGVRAARGPARCDRRWQCVDQWELTGELHPGMNVIAALVHHYGEWTFSYMLGRGGFLAEAVIKTVDGRTMIISTDNSWRVKPAEAWEKNLPRMSIQLGYPEVFDARREIEGWSQTGYDDSGWEYATVLGQPGMQPWPNLVPREIPAMMERPIRAKRVLATGEVGEARTGYYVDLLPLVWSTSNGVAYLVTFVWSPEEGEFEIHAGSQDAIKLWVNGKLLIRHLVTRDAAPDQEIVLVHLQSGWNSVLAKIVQGEGQWHFYFRIEGTGSERLVFSSSREIHPADAETLKPWWIIAPFEGKNLEHGFETPFGPEEEIDLHARYLGKGGLHIAWISAGVTKESSLPSVIMSREKRLPFIKGSIENPGGLIAPGESAVVHPGADHGCYAVIDFGKEVTGYPVVEISRASGGAVIDLGYGEVMQTPDGDIVSPASERIGIVNPDRGGVHYADRYICRPGIQRFQTFDKRAFRYLQVDIRNVSQPIAVGPISLVFSTYPVEYRGSFDCSDTILNRIWEVGRWTVQLSMEDAYSDSPWRERAQWWGDVRLEALVSYYCFGDLLLVKQGLRHIAQSQTPEGLTMAVYPTEWPDGILPTYTLLWVISLWDYYEHSGDRDLVNELFPTVERAMKYFERFRDDHDLINNVPYWLFVDWADVETAGESAAVNALYYGALVAAGNLAGAIGRRDTTAEYHTLSRRIRIAMRSRLWDSSRNLFRDSCVDGEVSQKISEQANSWAVVFGAVESEMASSVVEALFDTHEATVHAATPYFSYYVLNALARTGRHERSLEYIREHWKKMLDWGATTWWEVWEPKASLCHGWSSGPTHYLQAEILGVKPGTPGWEEICIIPHMAGLTWARGKVPTPRGTITVEWKREEDFTMTVEIPARATVAVPVLEQGDISVTTDGEQSSGLIERLSDDTRYVTFALRKPGKYLVRSR